jgi:hypothetical protein
MPFAVLREASFNFALFAQRSVGILPAHTLRPATPERPMLPHRLPR